jgi:hypothetical protein
MSKTQINAWLPAPEGREAEIAQQMKHVLQDADVDFGVSTVGPHDEAGMELVFLSEDLKDVPIMLIKLSLYEISTKSKAKAQQFLAKLAYQFRTEPLKSMISSPNKQYFIPTNEKSELIQIQFLNTGNHTEAEIDEIKSTVAKVSQNVLEKPGKYFSDYFNEISAKDPQMKLKRMDKDGKMHYQMLRENEEITDWVMHDMEKVDWDDFISKLYEEYKTKLNR